MSKQHALIIEDDPFSAEVLASLLATENVESIIVASVAQLSNAVNRLPPLDIVFVDLEMQDGNGYEALELLAAFPALSSVPFVACTVHISEINTARKMGFHSFLGKPLKSHRFKDQLRRILNDQPVWEVG